MKLRKLRPMLQKREQAPKCGSNEEGNIAVTVVIIDSLCLNPARNINVLAL
jgi:hypothetical protein